MPLAYLNFVSYDVRLGTMGATVQLPMHFICRVIHPAIHNAMKITQLIQFALECRSSVSEQVNHSWWHPLHHPSCNCSLPLAVSFSITLTAVWTVWFPPPLSLPLHLSPYSPLHSFLFLRQKQLKRTLTWVADTGVFCGALHRRQITPYGDRVVTVWNMLIASGIRITDF